MDSIEGWIPDNQPFAGTKTMHAPHDFGCRCSTSRRLTPPTVSEITKNQFNKDSTSYMDDAMKVMITGHVQDFRMKYPFIEKLPKLTDFKSAGSDYLLGATTKKYMSFNAIPSQWDSINDAVIAGRLTGNKRNKAVVYHEMGHHLDNTLDTLSKTDGVFGNVAWQDINLEKKVATQNLYEKWKTDQPQSLSYVLETEKEYGYDAALGEVFAESVVAHIMGIETDILDEDMRKLLDFLINQ